MKAGRLQTFLALPFSLRQRRLAKSRRPLSRDQFVQEIVAQGGDHAAAASLWERLDECMWAESFTPYPSDNLEHVFGIAEEERDEDLILGILGELNVTTSQEMVSRFGRVDTPLQVAQFVTFCREWPATPT